MLPPWPWPTIPRREPDHGHLVLEDVIQLWAARILRRLWGKGCTPVCWHVCKSRAAVGLGSVAALDRKSVYFSKNYFGFIWDKIQGTSSRSEWAPWFGVLRSRIWLGYGNYQGRDPLKKSARRERMLQKRLRQQRVWSLIIMPWHDPECLWSLTPQRHSIVGVASLSGLPIKRKCTRLCDSEFGDSHQARASLWILATISTTHRRKK